MLPLDQLVGSRDKFIFFEESLTPVTIKVFLSILPALEIDFAGFLRSQWSRGLGYLHSIDPPDGGGDPLYLADFSISSPLRFPAPEVPGLVLRLYLHGSYW